MMEIRLSLPADGECREFTLDGQGAANTPQQGFLVAINGTGYAYLNRCPHTGAPLNWMPDQFLNYENDMIQCALHGALFRIEDGYCLYGPCQGESLRSLPLQQEGAEVVIENESTKKD
jgi:nitrite reductase/ring-hydroxylating ferredoxin subunit